MSNILVTGGAGFIASALITRLLEKGHKIISVDNFITGKKKNIIDHENHTFLEADICSITEIEPIFSSFKIDYIFHYAALVGVKRTLENPVSVLQDFNAINNIFCLARDYKVNKIFYSSSSEVYGDSVYYPQEEDSTPLNSKLPYAVMKNVGESFCRSFKQEFNLDYTIFRFFNTYGPRQSEDFVISKFLAAAKKNQDLTIYGDGSQARTFCFIDDHIDATINSFDKNLFNNDVVNIGTNVETTILDLAKIIIMLTNSKSKIINLPPLKEGDMMRRQPDVKKMKSLLGREFTSLELGIQKTNNF